MRIQCHYAVFIGCTFRRIQFDLGFMHYIEKRRFFSSGVLSFTLGILMFAHGIIVGVLAIVKSGKLIHHSKNQPINEKTADQAA